MSIWGQHSNKYNCTLKTIGKRTKQAIGLLFYDSLRIQATMGPCPANLAFLAPVR